MGYFKQTAKGVSWVGGFRIFTRIISFLRTIILARILSPAQFGIYSISTLILAFLEILTETGINVFLIQESNSDKYINTAFIVSILRGMIISLIILVTSGLVTQFFNAPDVLPLLILVSVVPLIRGLINPSSAKFQKELNFGKDFLVRTVVFVVDSIISVIVTVVLASPIGIIWGLIAGSISEVILTWLIANPKPKFEFDSKKFTKVIARGKWVTLSGLFDYLSGNIDDTLVGKLLDTTSLGIYQMAYRLSTLPLTEVTQVFSKVTFPIYMKIANDKNRLKRAYQRTFLVIFALSVPLSVGLFVSSDFLIPWILGEKWIAVIPVLKVLCIFGALRSLTGTTFTIYLSQRKQSYIASLLFVEFIALSFLLLPFIKLFGLIGAGYATIIAVILPIPLNLFYLNLTFRKSKSSE